jgi:hypothetical protein
MVSLPLPLPYDLISLVCDYIVIKERLCHQDMHQRSINQINALVERWPIGEDERLKFPGYERLHRFAKPSSGSNSNWYYVSRSIEPGSDWTSPRLSIDQELREKDNTKKQ